MMIGATLSSLAAAAALALAGRGGDDDENGGARPQRQAGGGDARSAVELKEFAIELVRLVLKRRAMLDVQNTGAIPHNLTIERGPDATTPTERLAGMSTFGGGEERLRVQLPPGSYALVCTVAGDRQQGLAGSVTAR